MRTVGDLRRCRHTGSEDALGERSFVPNGDLLVSTCVGARENVVSPLRNDFYSFALFPH
jgi:hypothetical protein